MPELKTYDVTVKIVFRIVSTDGHSGAVRRAEEKVSPVVCPDTKAFGMPYIRDARIVDIASADTKYQS